MPEPCNFPSLVSCQKRFLWTYKKVDLAPHPVVGPVLQIGKASFFRHLISKAWILSFFTVSKQGPCFTSVEENGGDKSLSQPEHACEIDGVAPPNPV